FLLGAARTGRRRARPVPGLASRVPERHGDRDGVREPAGAAAGLRAAAVDLEVAHGRADTQELVLRREAVAVGDDIGQRPGVAPAGDRSGAGHVEALRAAEAEVEVLGGARAG